MWVKEALEIWNIVAAEHNQRTLNTNTGWKSNCSQRENCHYSIKTKLDISLDFMDGTALNDRMCLDKLGLYAVSQAIGETRHSKTHWILKKIKFPLNKRQSFPWRFSLRGNGHCEKSYNSSVNFTPGKTSDAICSVFTCCLPLTWRISLRHVVKHFTSLVRFILRQAKWDFVSSAS